MTTPSVTQVADGTYFVDAGSVNWILLGDGRALTLVDAGYPAHRDAVVASVESIGHRMTDVEAILVTHAHVDHIGSIPALVQQFSTPVLTSDREARHARREYLEQATPAAVARNVWRPGVAGWALHIMRQGGLEKVSVPEARGFGDASPLDLPGRPVPVATPGHTSGHTAYLLPDVGAVVSGDALITGHGTSRREGPQFLLPMFHHDVDAAHRAIGALASSGADVLLPGHGPVYRGSIDEAVERALRSSR
ncbi:MBL fold metallo-hydrolase [Rhodococcus sp. HNM0569]|uniref:MBL fold metallo-hydrolase n=1 Tax=Rhodococcus sp. HNM0569 TaxID=2716340 RepID=UPI00146E8875|nr:MBL fold metallo-hydrolase [Rhodococcus sp. HNM0569]NLU84618.1 MBL fold metallo-hydrolase [Rhodococcus sp. HNM0569]